MANGDKKPALTEEQKNEQLQKRGLGGAGADALMPELTGGEPPTAPPPVNNPRPLGYNAIQPLLDMLLNKWNGINAQGQQVPPMYQMIPPPMGIPQMGNEGPMMLPPPPQAGMPRP